MNHFIQNQQGWKALLLLPGLACSGYSYAVPDLQGKFIHESVNLENGMPERHNRNEPLLLRLPANDGDQVENGLDVNDFKIYHTLPDNNQYVLNLNVDSDFPSDAISSSNSGYLEITIPDEWESGRHCFSAAAMSGGVEGGRTALQCVTLYSEASNLFKTGALTDQPDTQGRTSFCLPSEVYFRWHEEIYSSPVSTASRNGHILGVSTRSFAVDGKLTYQIDGGGTVRCELEDTDADTLLGYEYDENGKPVFDKKGNHVYELKERTRRVRVTRDDARKIVHKEADETNGMLYVKTHACAWGREADPEEPSALQNKIFSCLQGSSNRAELSYDRKVEDGSTYTDGKTHTQQGDVFWVTYRFNAVSLFETGNYDPPKIDDPDPYDIEDRVNYRSDLVREKSYVYLSQFHPNTANLAAYDKKTGTDKDCDTDTNTCGHAPSFGVMLKPIIDTVKKTIDGKQAELYFNTKYIWEKSDGFTDNGVDELGPIRIDLKKWYQVKIGIKFSTGNDGWAIAAVRVDCEKADSGCTKENGEWKGGDWQYLKHKDALPLYEGSVFRGRTLHAPPCRYRNGNQEIVDDGPIGRDCVSDSQKHFETVFKFGGYFDRVLWHGSTERHLEILFDDIYAFDSHHEPVQNEWPANLGAANDPLKNHRDLEKDNDIYNIGFTPQALTQTVETYPEPCKNAACTN